MSSLFPLFSIFLVVEYCRGLLTTKSHGNSFFKIALCIHVLVSLFLQDGFFIRLGGESISYSEATLLIAVVSYAMRNGINRAFTLSNICLFLIVVFGWIINELFPSGYLSVPVGVFWNPRNAVIPSFRFSDVKYLLRIMGFFFLVNGAFSGLGKNELYKFESLVIKLEILTLIIFLFEFFTKNVMGLSIHETIKEYILGNDPNEYKNPYIYSRGGTSAITGLFFEPSAFCWSQLICCVMLIKTEYRYKNVLIILSLIAQLLTGSFSSLLTASVAMVFLLLNNRSTTIVFLFSIFVLVGGIIAYRALQTNELAEYYLGRVTDSLNTFGNNLGDSEGESRIVSMIESLQVFIRRPLFGVGLGSNYSYSFIPTGLANIGLLGMAFWLDSINYGIRKTIVDRDRRSNISLIILAITYCLIGTIGNLYEISTFMLMAYAVKPVNKVNERVRAWLQ